MPGTNDGWNSFLIKSNGKVVAVGGNSDGNSQGQLGLGHTNDVITPTTITSLSDIVKVSHTGDFTLFLKADGTVYSSGYGGTGKLGHGNTNSISTATQISGLTNVIDVLAVNSSSFFLIKDGTVKVCGYNNNNQISPGSTSDITTPTAITGLSDVVNIASSGQFTFFVINDGTVKGIGNGTNGIAGDGADSRDYNTLTTISGLSNVIQMSCGTDHALAVLTDGTVKSAGNGTDGKSGQYGNAVVNSWTTVSDISDIIYVWADANHSMFLKSNGTLYGCGSNQGQLGTGSTGTVRERTETGFTNVASFYTSRRITYIVDKDGNFKYSGYSQGGFEFYTGAVSSSVVSSATTQTTTTYVANTWNFGESSQRLQGNNVFKHLESSTAISAADYPSKFRFLTNSTSGTYAVSFKKVETMESEGTFYANSDTSSSSSSSGGDPYVNTIYGVLYKLDNISGYCRMLQGNINNKKFILNVEMKRDNFNDEENMNSWSTYWDNTDIIKNNEDSHCQINQSFFTKVYVNYDNSELIFDIPNFKVIKYTGKNIVLKYLTNKNYSNLPMYTNDSTEDTIAVKCGEVFIKILRSSNKQIRSEVSLGGHSHIEDPYGFLVLPMNTKVCKLKKLDTIKLLEKKKTPNFKREVHNYFYTINKDTKQYEKKIQSIKCF